MDWSYSTAVGLFNSVVNFVIIILANTISRKSAIRRCGKRKGDFAMNENINNHIKTSPAEIIFSVFNYTFIAALMFVMIYPLWYVLMASFSDAIELSSFSGFLFKPLKFSTAAYRLMMKNPMILRGYGNTLFVLVVGLAINMVMTCIGAYFTSRKDVMFCRTITLLIIFTMYFSGGMIPFYMTVKGLGLGKQLVFSYNSRRGKHI